MFATVLGEGERRVDEPDMCERLREVPEGRAGVGVYLLREEAHVVRVGQQLLEGQGGSFDVAAAGHAFHRPEAAEPECSLAGREPVVGPCLVAVDQLVAREHLMDAGACGAHPRVLALDVAVERQGQEARIHLLAVEGARVAPYPLVVPVGFDLPPDLAPLLAEEVYRNLQVPGFVHLDEAIECDPTQDLRVGVMESAGAPLPDALIRFSPAPAHRTTETVEHPTRVAVEASAAVQEPGGAVDDLPIDIKLELALSVVADPHRARRGVALQMR